MILTTMRKLDGFKPSSFILARVGSETTGSGRRRCSGKGYRAHAVKSRF
jgi:hypothetical protein